MSNVGTAEPETAGQPVSSLADSITTAPGYNAEVIDTVGQGSVQFRYRPPKPPCRSKAPQGRCRRSHRNARDLPVAAPQSSGLHATTACRRH
jgi:hypothetical protein